MISGKEEKERQEVTNLWPVAFTGFGCRPILKIGGGKRMRKLLIVFLLVIFFSRVAHAGIFFPRGFTPSILSLYDLGKTKAWWEGPVLAVLGAKDYVYLDFGALTVIEKTTPVGGISFNIPKILALLPGIPDIEIKGLVTIGYGISRNIRDACTMHGLTIRKSF